jgi:hypothetical protein
MPDLPRRQGLPQLQRDRPAMKGWLVLAYFVGYFITWLAVSSRAGVSIWVPVIKLRPIPVMIDYFWRLFFKCTFWPIALVWWIANGQPDPKVAWGARAEEIQARINERRKVA